MRIAIISDIHSNLSALRAVLAQIKTIGADLVVNLGDVVSGPLEPAGVIDELAGFDVLTISGNHDRYLVEAADKGAAPKGTSDLFAFERLGSDHFDWLRNLSKGATVADDNVLLCHGSPQSDVSYLLEEVGPEGVVLANEQHINQQMGGTISHQVVLCGHTHLPRAVSMQCGALVVNPGSVGMQAYGDLQPFSHKLETGSPHARYAWIERMGKQWHVNFGCVAYDWDGASQLARRHGRDDWARRLLTGRA